MTIPYLRQRNYTSTLGEREQISDGAASYTSYVTRYDSDGLNIQWLLTPPKGDYA